MPCLPWMTIMDEFGVGVTIHHHIYIYIYIGEHMKNDNYFGQMLFLLFLQINYF